MQQNSGLYKFCIDYSIVAFGAVLLLAVVAASTQMGAALPSGALDQSAWRAAGVFDLHVAALMSAATLLIFSGLWRKVPTTRAGRWALRITVVSLVAINWAAWVVALWWH